MLWPSFYMSKLKDYPDPILTEMPKIHVAAEGACEAMYTANCTAEVEDIAPGTELFWFVAKDEIHHILKGEADMTYSLAGTSHTEKKSAHLTAGDWYIAPNGARITWKVTSSVPLRLLWLTMPGVPKSPHKRTESIRL